MIKRGRFYFLLIVLVCLGFVAKAWCAMQQPDAPTIPFSGEIKEDRVNVRMDATVGSEVICTVFRREPVEVIGEVYDWYKIRLPQSAPSFVKKTLVAIIDDKTIKVLKDSVNIRLKPSEDSPIIGKAEIDELLQVRRHAGEWFEIEPVANSFGWVHKRFVLPFRTTLPPPAKQPEREQ